jgi:putative colanic acid biosynthesis acetyltransferase WcaF
MRCRCTNPSDNKMDVQANRAARKWTRAEQLGRALWSVGRILFRFSPRPFWWWRVFILRCFGASIDRKVHIHPTVRIEIPWNLRIGTYVAIGDRAILYNLGRITIGPSVTISQGAHLCAGTHDYQRRDFPLIKAPIVIGEGAWICADAFIAPNIEVGDRAIVGARAVVVDNVIPDCIVAGNPAKIIKRRS